MSDSSKVLKSKTRKVYKSNKLNKASFGNYNLNDYRVYLNAIALIGGIDAQGKYLQQSELTQEYTLRAVEFANQFNIATNHAYEILKNAADKLMKTDIKIEMPDLLETWRINVCERVKYNPNQGTITILFTKSIMEYLRQRTKNFTLYNLKEVADLTSFYAVRLYEMIQQYNTSTGMLVHTLAQWREILGIAPEQYKMYHQIKQKVFTQALEEINNKTGYHITMTEIKEGRKVARVKFDFEPDKILTGLDKRTGKMSTRHKKPKKPVIPTQEPIPEVHPDQQELEL